MKSPFGTGGSLHGLKNLYLRYRDGAGCCDAYSLDSYLIPKILPSLKAFRANYARNGYPTEFSNINEWYAVLDEIIWAFEWSEATSGHIEEGEDLLQSRYMADVKRQQKGFELFGKHFQSLWY